MMSEHPIRILIADDHDTVRRGLAIFIESQIDFELVGEATNGVEALALVEQHHPDLVLMDVMMPEMDGITAAAAIAARYPATRIIGLSSSRESTHAEGMAQAGAVNFLSKTVSVQELASAIYQALEMPA
jgi:DNA-binding NarL/FixJ family response regulator